MIELPRPPVATTASDLGPPDGVGVLRDLYRAFNGLTKIILAPGVRTRYLLVNYAASHPQLPITFPDVVQDEDVVAGLQGYSMALSTQYHRASHDCPAKLRRNHDADDAVYLLATPYMEDRG